MATTQPNSERTAAHTSAAIVPSQASFLVIHCSRCAKDVLTARGLDKQGRFVDACLHCEAPLDRDDPSARWVDAERLVERGYIVEGHASASDGDGERGCRGGSCGIRQPE